MWLVKDHEATIPPWDNADGILSIASGTLSTGRARCGRTATRREFESGDSSRWRTANGECDGRPARWPAVSRVALRRANRLNSSKSRLIWPDRAWRLPTRWPFTRPPRLSSSVPESWLQTCASPEGAVAGMLQERAGPGPCSPHLPGRLSYRRGRGGRDEADAGLTQAFTVFLIFLAPLSVFAPVCESATACSGQAPWDRALLPARVPLAGLESGFCTMGAVETLTEP